tara:strand:- start:203 stop:946 length:744 start_codon:yes stop_codon:yes gene_type:complete
LIQNYQIIIEYLGSKFVGWQAQKNGNSIQMTLEKAISKTLKSKIKIIGSGRTDAGVNAIGQSANFFFKNNIINKYKFISTVNYFLNKDLISITNLKKRKRTFHARHSAKKRQYEYVILNRIAKPSVDKDRVWLVKKKLDLKKMRKGISFFIGTHNFSAFRSSSCGSKSPIRTINNVAITKKADKIFIKFISKSFLQKQVRSMVGCLKYVGEGKWKPSDIKNVIFSKKRDRCAPPAPAQGLYLKKVFY